MRPCRRWMLLRYQLDQRSRLSCPPSRPFPGHRERLTATASRSPHTRARHLAADAWDFRLAAIPAQLRVGLFAGFRSFVSAPVVPRMTGICGPVAPRVQIRRLGDAIGGMLPARRGPKRLRRHCSCVCLAEARPAAVDTSPAHRRIGLRRSERRVGKPASLTRRDLSIYRRPG
jgi:hypothetical protein